MSDKAKKVHELLSLRDQILRADDAQAERVHVSEWGVDVWVRGLTGAERDAIEDSMVKGRGKIDLGNFRARLLVKTVVDEDGKRIFNDEDATALGAKSAAALERLVNVAMRLAGIRAGDVEELAKNSAPGPSEGSTSN